MTQTIISDRLRDDLAAAALIGAADYRSRVLATGWHPDPSKSQEVYHPDDLTTLIAICQGSFKALNLTWKSDRIQAHLAWVSKQLQTPIKTGADLPYVSYCVLCQKLKAASTEQFARLT
jgi:hypothetical protein